jgi:hypothetical protein
MTLKISSELGEASRSFKALTPALSLRKRERSSKTSAAAFLLPSGEGQDEGLAAA